MAALLAAACIIPHGVARADSWTNLAGNSQWSTGGNWSPGPGVPPAGAVVVNTTGTLIIFNTNASVTSFTSNGAFTITGGTLSGSQPNSASPIEIDNLFTLNGGGLSGVTLNQGVNGTVSIASNGGNFITNSTINADLPVNGGYIQLFSLIVLNSQLTLTTGGHLQVRDGNANLSVSATGTIHGAGVIDQTFGGANLTNAGLISADASTQSLTLGTSNITGTGVFQAINGATLAISGLFNGVNASVHADTGTVLVNGGGLTGVTASATGTGFTFANNGSNYISNATVNGNLTFGQGGYVQVYNTNAVSGTIAMASTANGIQLRDGNAFLEVTATGLLHGYGTVYQTFGGSTLIDNGTLSADVSGNVLAINNSNLTGSGVLDARNGGTLSIGAQLNGAGIQVTVDATSQVVINGGSLTGLVASTTGTGISFANNGNNYATGATVNGTLTFPEGGYAQVYNLNTVNGAVVMGSHANGIQLRDGNAVLTIGAPAVMHGYGTVYQTFGGSTLQNLGTVSADVSGETLALNPSNITGSGVFQAVGGGILSIGGLLNGSNASVHADTGTVQINGGGLTGTIASSTGTGITFANNGNNFISSATVNGNVTFPNGGYAQVYNINTVSGLLTMASTANGIQLRDGNASLEITAAGTLHGYGTVYQTFGGGTFVDNGLVSADSNGNILRLNNSHVSGSGVLDARNGGILYIGALVSASNMQVHVDATPGSVVAVNGGGLAGHLGATTGTGLSFANNGNNTINSATVDGTLTFGEGGFAQALGSNTINGSIDMSSHSNGVQLRDGNAFLNISATGRLHGFGTVYQLFGGSTVSNAGLIAADAPGESLALNVTTVITSGTVRVDPVTSMSVGGTFTQTAGLTTVDGNLSLASAMALQGGTLNGDGTITGGVNNTGGLVSPGHSPGLLSTTGNYFQSSSAGLEIELGGYDPGISYDRLSVGGTATVAGNLNVDLVDGFLPQVGDVFTIVLRNGGSGSFGTTTASAALGYTVAYNPTNIQITITAVPAPEPASLLLMAAVLPLLGPMRRRRGRGH